MIIKRDTLLQKLVRSKHNGMIKIVTGIRRAGKSFLLFKLFVQHLNDEGIENSHIIKIDLEDRRNKDLRDPDALLQYIDNKMTDNQMYYILIDEIQLVNEFEDVLNSYLKIDNADLYVTGSNSRFLSNDVITEFRGRGEEIRVTPLTFREFMPTQSNRNTAFEEYLLYGGLPQVALMDDIEQKKDYLKALFSKVYLTDIKERYGIKNDDDLSLGTRAVDGMH